MQIEELEEEFVELLGYILASARGLVDEPRRHGPLRLIETARRLGALMRRAGLGGGLFEDVGARLEGRGTPRDEEELAHFLDGLVLLVAREIKRV